MRLTIPIKLVFDGGGMPWTLQGELTTDWTAVAVTSPYIAVGYIAPDYFDDDEWVITADPNQTWTLVP